VNFLKGLYVVGWIHDKYLIQNSIGWNVSSIKLKLLLMWQVRVSIFGTLTVDALIWFHHRSKRYKPTPPPLLSGYFLFWLIDPADIVLTLADTPKDNHTILVPHSNDNHDLLPLKDPN